MMYQVQASSLGRPVPKTGSMQTLPRSMQALWEIAACRVLILLPCPQLLGDQEVLGMQFSH